MRQNGTAGPRRADYSHKEDGKQITNRAILAKIYQQKLHLQSVISFIMIAAKTITLYASEKY